MNAFGSVLIALEPSQLTVEYPPKIKELPLAL
jgi:hypothetical protein